MAVPMTPESASKPVPAPPPYSEQDRIWDAARETLPSNIEEKPKLIAVMGPTGTGKSTFISKLAAREMKIGHHLHSCKKHSQHHEKALLSDVGRSGTDQVEEVPCKVGDEYVILVDTPGFNDTHRSDTEILTALADWMKSSYHDEMILDGIIYLHAISDTRMTNSSLRNLHMFRRLVGNHNLKNVVLATTKWSVPPHEDELRREKDLTSEFWSTMMAAGSVVERFENDAASAQRLVKKILRLDKKIVPKIQEEVVHGKKLADTEAGAYIEQAIARLQKEHEEEKQTLLEEVQRARSEHNLAMQKALEAERERLDKRMAERVEEQRQLHMTTNEALQMRINKLEQARQAEEAVDLTESEEELAQALFVQGASTIRHAPKVKRGFWHSRWKCQICKERKTEKQGLWTCPDCKHVQRNID
ncbi:MAG: hypothetical protein Q9204_008653 [Flavoplaca sp. TL-2023a]